MRAIEAMVFVAIVYAVLFLDPLAAIASITDAGPQ